MKEFLDTSLLILFFTTLAGNFTSAQAHEMLGITFIALIIAHNLLNRHFYKSFLRGNFNWRRLINHVVIIFFAISILVAAISGSALADYFPAPDLNWRSIHLGAAICSTVALFIHILIHASRYIKGKSFYFASMLVFILAVGAVFGLPYLDRWFHKVEVNRSELLRGDKLNLDGKILIVYFSRVGNTNFPAEVDAVSGASLMLDGKNIVGNAQMIAEFVQNITGGDIFPLQTEKIYPANYSETTKVAHKEFLNGELPTITKFPNVEGYDKIILIYPLWWSNLPKSVEHFLRSYDLTDKKIYPIVTHGGGGLGDSIDTLKNSTLAEIATPLDIYSSDIPASRKIIFDWLKNSLLNFNAVAK